MKSQMKFEVKYFDKLFKQYKTLTNECVNKQNNFVMKYSFEKTV